MSCADVCIDQDADNDNEFYTERMRRARRPHVCGECHATILPGQLYEYAAGKSDGTMWTAKTCALCAEIRKAFVCGSFYFTQLWEAIEAQMFPIWNERGPIDCLAQLETLEARNLARRKYDEWKDIVGK